MCGAGCGCFGALTNLSVAVQAPTCMRVDAVVHAASGTLDGLAPAASPRPAVIGALHGGHPHEDMTDDVANAAAALFAASTPKMEVLPDKPADR